MASAIHGMQEITFNPLAKKGDKDYSLLYIGIGDGGSEGRGHAWISYGATQPWGAVYRIDPKGNNSSNGKYGIPEDNPFVGNDKGWMPEIYAHGFRNPHRITWTKSGEILVSNIGQGQIESLREGTFELKPEDDSNMVFPLPENEKSFGFSYPVAMYDHDEGNAISGGYEYTGTEVPGLNGKYLFGDITRGRLFYVNIADLEVGKQAPIDESNLIYRAYTIMKEIGREEEWTVEYEGVSIPLAKLAGSRRVDLRFGKDASGEMYLFTKADGKVYKMASIKE